MPVAGYNVGLKDWRIREVDLNLPQLRMEKRDLEFVPDAILPEGYWLRTFVPGDESGLAAVYEVCGLGCTTREDVRERVTSRPFFHPGRLFVVEWNRQLVGTAAAWEEASDPPCGYLHMVGVVPTQRNQGLGTALVAAAIRRNREEGYTVQRLDTDDFRLGAIRMYLRLGYCPILTHPSHADRWKAVSQQLGIEALTSRACISNLIRRKCTDNNDES